MGSEKVEKAPDLMITIIILPMNYEKTNGQYMPI